MRGGVGGGVGVRGWVGGWGGRRYGSSGVCVEVLDIGVWGAHHTMWLVGRGAVCGLVVKIALTIT